MKFRDIPQMTQANYQTHTPWGSLVKILDHYRQDVEVDLDPDFQRAHVWDDHKRTRYVEFILRGGTSGQDIYFNCPGWMGKFEGPMVLVDGKQRLTAVLKFLNDEIPAFGLKYSEFEDKLPYTRPHFIFHINDLKTRAEELQWYLDLNDGGVAHTSEEIKLVQDLLEKEHSTREELPE